jgi:hypothetical protein
MTSLSSSASRPLPPPADVAIPKTSPQPLGALLRRAFDDEDHWAPTVDDQERYVRDDDEGYSA